MITRRPQGCRIEDAAIEGKRRLPKEAAEEGIAAKAAAIEKRLKLENQLTSLE